MEGTSAYSGKSTWYRNGSTDFNIYIFLVFIVLFWGLVLVSEHDWNRKGLLIAVPSGLAVAVLCGVLVILGKRSGISVNADGVTVRGQLTRSRHVPWHEVVRFAAAPGERRPFGYRGSTITSNYVTVVCRDRPPLQTSACAFNTLDTSGLLGAGTEMVYQIVDALEAARHQAQHAAGTAAS